MGVHFQEYTYKYFENISHIIIALCRPQELAYINKSFKGKVILQYYYEVDDNHQISAVKLSYEH